MLVTYKLRLFASSEMFFIRLQAAAGSAERIDHFARYVDGVRSLIENSTVLLLSLRRAFMNNHHCSLLTVQVEI